MLFQEFVGDLQINLIDKKVTRDFKAQYIKTPSNRNKKRQYRDKTIAELLSMEIPKEDLIDAGTVHSNMTRIGSFFGWAKDHDYIGINPIEGVKPKKNKRKKASEQRDIFSKEDLAKLFESDEYRSGFLRGGDLWKYWIPLIGLYTGMRLEEICRLRIDCFEFVDGIVTVEIKPDGEWLGKTNAALRAFAVHPKLIELGLLKFVEQQRAAGKQRLFDELKKGRDGYGARVTKWFARFCDRLGIVDERKVFHSFRHTLLNELKQRGVALEVREAIAGHENKSQSESRYGKAYIAKITFEAIQKADFGLDHPEWRGDRDSAIKFLTY
jgi:integrase